MTEWANDLKMKMDTWLAVEIHIQVFPYVPVLFGAAKSLAEVRSKLWQLH